MRKKTHVARELANTFPPWSKTRKDEQSIGFQMLNALSRPMERMDKALVSMRANQYLTTANLDEIDILHRVILPTDFEFDADNSDPNVPISLAPTVKGTIDSDIYTVAATIDNDIEAFWYESIPTRVSLDDTVSGNHQLLDCVASELPQANELEHHLAGGHLWIETISGYNYLAFEKGTLHRARLIVHGVTRKGTEEYESFTFPWDMRQRSQKEWKVITKVEGVNLEEQVGVRIDSANFNAEDHIGQWNLRFSENRNKIDEFWGLGEISGHCTLDLVEYVTDEWQQLVIGLTDKQIKESWELLDDTMSGVDAVDITLQPFSDRAWAVTADQQLYCYDLEQNQVSGVDMLKDGTSGSHIQIEMDFRTVVLDEYIEFLPWHARPLKEIKKYRLWYQTPSGTKYGLLGGSPVAYTSDFWVIGEETISRTVENLVRVQATERGEYMFVLEAIFVDDEEQNTRVICSVNYKQPLASFDLSSLITEDITGIDFDSDQKLWVQTVTGDYHEIGLHTDVMLIDYEGKIIYFKEQYDSVEVITSG